MASLYDSRDYWAGQVAKYDRILREYEAFEPVLDKAYTDLSACIDDLEYVKSSLANCLQIDDKSYKIDELNKDINNLKLRRKYLKETVQKGVISKHNETKISRNNARSNYNYYVSEIQKEESKKE